MTKANGKFDFLSEAKALAPEEIVDLAEFGIKHKIKVRGLTARQISTANKAATTIISKGKRGKPDETDVDGEKLSTALLAKSLHNIDGDPLVEDGKEDELFDLPHELVTFLTKVVFRLNGMSGAVEGETPEGN